jgi:hypothetical protein
MSSVLYPHELQFGDVYVTPILIVLFLAFFLTLFSVIFLNKTRLAKWFYMPQYVFLSMMILYSLFIDKFFIRF